MDGAREYDLEPDRDGADLSLGSRRLLAATLEDAFRVLDGSHAGRRAEVYRWFTDDRRDYVTACVSLCDALNLPLRDIRTEALRRWGETIMPLGDECEGICAECNEEFSYLRAKGRPPSRCEPCKAPRTEINTEGHDLNVDMGATRRPGVTLPRPKVTAKRKPPAPATHLNGNADSVVDLVAEWKAAEQRIDAIKAEIADLLEIA